MTEQAVQPTEESATEGARIRTFLIADVRGYTKFTVQHGDEAAAHLAASFAALVRDVVRKRAGRVVELRGDEALAVFDSVRQGLWAAVELQERSARDTSEMLPLQVGIGMDAGEAVPVEGGYRGAALNLAARLCALATAGEVLVSDTVANLARRIDGLEYTEHGSRTLKGFAEPVRVLRVRRTVLGDALGAGTVDVAAPGQDATQPLPTGGYLGALPAAGLVGRDTELLRLRSAVDAVDRGAGRLVLLAGEPGAGKTRLAQEATRDVWNRGFTVIAGRCYEPQQAVPFYPFIDALTTAYSVAPQAIRAQVTTRWPGIAQVLPALGLAHTDSAGPPDQQRLLWSVTEFLRALAAERPLALLLDDLHWADAASVDLLQHLARHTGTDRMLIIGAYRDDEINAHPALHAALRDLEREGIVERIVVARFTRDDTGALVTAMTEGTDVTAGLIDLVFDRTEGNPFFVHQVVRMLVERGDISGGHGPGLGITQIDVPDTVRSVISQRLSRLSPGTQDILHEASVLGQTFRWEDLHAISGREEIDLERALEEAMLVGLVRESARDEYGFDHALTQHVLYSQIPSRRRRRLHLSAATALERLPEPLRDRRAAELARHSLHGDDLPRALVYSLRAGDLAEAIFAHDDAALHYETARDLAQELGDVESSAAVHERLGGLYTAIIRYDQALPALDRAARLYHDIGDRAAEARVVAQIGRVHVAGGSVHEGIQRLQGTLASLREERLPASEAALLSSLARLLFIRGEYTPALQAAGQAVSHAREHNLPGLQAEAEVTGGAALALTGEWKSALAALAAAVETARAADDLFSLCRGLQHIAGVRLAQGNRAAATDAMTGAMELADRMGNRRQLATTLFSLAVIDFVTGGTRVVERAEEAHAMMSGLGGYWLRFLHSAALSLHFPLAQWDAMPEVLKETIAPSEQLSETSTLRGLRFRAERELLDGEVAAALAHLETVRTHPALEHEQLYGMVPLLAEAYLAGDDIAAAERVLTDALEHVKQQELRLLLPDLLRVSGLVAARTGDAARAVAFFDEAAAEAAAIPYPAATARVHASREAALHR